MGIQFLWQGGIDATSIEDETEVRRGGAGQHRREEKVIASADLRHSRRKIAQRIPR